MVVVAGNSRRLVPRSSPLAAAPAAATRRQGLDVLVATYWKPIYHYLRVKRCATNDEAKDVTQAFLARLIETDLLAQYDASRASLRTYLRLCLDGFVQNERQATARLKRGGGRAIQSLDFAAADAETALGVVDSAADPEQAFEHAWTRSVIELAIETLAAECRETAMRSAGPSSSGTTSTTRRPDRVRHTPGSLRTSGWPRRG